MFKPCQHPHSTWTVGFALIGLATPCLGAGPWLAEAGGSDMGMAGAGRAAISLDAAALAANPAAMGGLAGSTVTAAVMPLELDFEFQGSAVTPAAASNREGVAVIPALFAVRRAGRMTYGIGAYSYFGLAFDAGNEWAGRRVIEQAGIATFNVAPAVAWQATDRLAVGAAVAAQWIEPTARLAVANDATFYGPPTGLPDGQLELSGQSWGTGGQLGLTYTLAPGATIGLAWTAPVDHTIAFDIAARDLHPILATLLPPDGAAKLDLTLPQQALLGLAYPAGDSTMLAVGLSWQDWSEFGAAQLRLPGTSSPMIASGLNDTWGASIGVRRRFSDHWAASAGIGYESDPATAGGVPTYFPVAEQWRIAAGAEHSCNAAWRLRVELSVVLQGTADVVQLTHPLPLPGIPPLTGAYQDTRVYLLAVAADFAP